MQVSTSPEFKSKLNQYPEPAKSKLEYIRALVHSTAEEVESIQVMEETLKWGEPSFVVKKGSTLRMDWKAKKPDQVAVYFKCTSRLVETFQTVFGDLFLYEGTRAIVFDLSAAIPEQALKECIKATLTYHKVKQLPTLGIQV